MVASVSGENNVLIYGSMINTESQNAVNANEKNAQPKGDANINPENVGASNKLPTTSTVAGNSKSSVADNNSKSPEDSNSPTQYTVDQSAEDVVKNYSKIIEENINSSDSNVSQTEDGTTTTYNNSEDLEGYNKFFDNKIKEAYANNTEKEPISYFTLSA